MKSIYLSQSLRDQSAGQRGLLGLLEPRRYEIWKIFGHRPTYLILMKSSTSDFLNFETSHNSIQNTYLDVHQKGIDFIPIHCITIQIIPQMAILRNRISRKHLEHVLAMFHYAQSTVSCFV